MSIVRFNAAQQRAADAAACDKRDKRNRAKRDGRLPTRSPQRRMIIRGQRVAVSAA